MLPLITPEPPSSDTGRDDAPSIHEERLWHEQGWTARIMRSEDGEGWSVEMTPDGEHEPALIGPWPSGRDAQQPRALDASAFNALVKGASEIRQHNERQLQAMLHRHLSVFALEREWEVVLDIVPDEYEPHAILRAIDADGVMVARQRVEAAFILSGAAAQAWIVSGFRLPGQHDE